MPETDSNAARAALDGLDAVAREQVLALLCQRSPGAVLDAVAALHRHAAVMAALLSDSRGPQPPAVVRDAPARPRKWRLGNVAGWDGVPVQVPGQLPLT